MGKYPLTRRITLIILIIMSLVFSSCSKEKETGPGAPAFSLKDLSGNKVTLEAHRGSIVLLDFWATWCGPCRLSIPELVHLQKKYGDQGLRIIGVSMDDPQIYNNNFLRAFKKKFRINYPIIRADEKIKRDYFSTEKIGIPTMFIIDREGVIVDKLIGFLPGAVENSIKKWL